MPGFVSRVLIAAVLGIGAATALASPGKAVTPSPPMPDMIVDSNTLAHNWLVKTEDLEASDCSVQEGAVHPGVHRILRFTVSTPNIGSAPLSVGDPLQHVAANDGMFEYATCHNHFHFRHYSLYQLVDPRSGKVWVAAKRGFCMTDDVRFPDNHPGVVPAKPHFTTCGTTTIPGDQGVSPGWSDVYYWNIPGQYILLDGGDGQPVVPPGRYLLRITVNPPYAPSVDEPCRYRDPIVPTVCHELPESNYRNNMGQTFVIIPRAATAFGPGPISQVSRSNPHLR